jgi:prepilin signal peptidase PulO-like enzyme (type II secretory pathway)
MKRLFYIGLVLLAAFEFLKVYFIMPFPGSQQAETLDLAYFLHSNRWYLRILFGLMIVGGAVSAFSVRRKWIPVVLILLAAWVAYYFNMKMMADRIFLEPETLTFEGRSAKCA